MSVKRATSKRRKPAASGILLRYRDRDSALGVSETQVIHVALAQLARQTLPQ